MLCPTLRPEIENSKRIPSTATKMIKGLEKAQGRVNHRFQVCEGLPPRVQGSWRNGIEEWVRHKALDSEGIA